MKPTPEHREAPKEYAVAVLSPELWRELKEQILDIYVECFPKYIAEDRKIDEKMLAKVYLDFGFIAVLTHASNKRVIGFSACRISPYDPSTANIGITAIRPEHRGKRLVGELMTCVEAELKKRGVTHMTRTARASEGYADAIERHYKDQIVEKADLPDTLTSDPKRHFKIKL